MGHKIMLGCITLSISLYIQPTHLAVQIPFRNFSFPFRFQPRNDKLRNRNLEPFGFVVHSEK